MPSVAPLLKETVLIAFAGLALGVGANALSPRGLSLTRDYFAGKAAPQPSAMSTKTSSDPASASTEPTVRAAAHEEVVAWFNDPAREAGRILFVDARSETHFEAGHIPGAHLFDHYHPERNVADILAAAALAERIVVYCRGGDCEDSELAANHLAALGVPVAKLAIYRGGFTEWQRRGMPVEAARPNGDSP